MSRFITDIQMYGDAHTSDSGHDTGSFDYGGGDVGHGDGSPVGMSGFEVNF
jgi:hypothetical protein